MYQITFGFSHTLFFELEALVLDYHTRRISRHQELEPECSLANCFNLEMIIT